MPPATPNLPGALPGLPNPVIFRSGESLKALKRTGIILAIAAVLVFASYQLADDTVMNLIQYSGPDNIPGTLQTVGTTLIFTYILGVTAIVAIIYSSIANLFK